MAGRGGGMAIFAAISSILVVVLFVLTVVFYFQAGRPSARSDDPE